MVEGDGEREERNGFGEEDIGSDWERAKNEGIGIEKGGKGTRIDAEGND